MTLYQQLKDTIQSLRPTLYYATQPDIKRGKAYISRKTGFTPEFIVCHPADLPEIEAELASQLVHIRDWKPTTIQWNPVPRADPGQCHET